MTNWYHRSVGKRLYTARKEKRMSRGELGELTGFHETTIKRYEDGSVASLDVQKLKKFADALDIDFIDLIFMDDALINLKPRTDYESQLLIMARQSGKLTTPEQQEKLLKYIKSTMKMYLEAVGVIEEDE